MSELKSRREALEEKISDLETALADLKTQLKAENEREQHEAIERLEEYLGDLDNKYAKLQDFWTILRDEIRDLFSSRSDDNGKPS